MVDRRSVPHAVPICSGVPQSERRRYPCTVLSSPCGAFPSGSVARADVQTRSTRSERARLPSSPRRHPVRVWTSARPQALTPDAQRWLPSHSPVSVFALISHLTTRAVMSAIWSLGPPVLDPPNRRYPPSSSDTVLSTALVTSVGGPTSRSGASGEVPRDGGAPGRTVDHVEQPRPRGHTRATGPDSATTSPSLARGEGL